MKQILSALGLATMVALHAGATDNVPAAEQLPADSTLAVPSVVTATAAPAAAEATSRHTLAKVMQKFNPSIKFGGYIIAKLSATDQSGKTPKTDLDLRFIRLYASGYCFQDFFYKLQMEVNAAPGDDKGPRVVDAFVEWQKWNFLRVKVGQFKRSFGFENPYSPLDVGLGSFSQASMKLASIKDTNGEHKSSGRDLGVQLQGDLLRAADGHDWLHYQIGLFNGQGINHGDKDNHKDLIGGLWLSPLKALQVGGFGWNGTYVNEKYDATNPLHMKRAKRVRWGVGVKYEDKWTVRSEYMSSVGGNVMNANAPHRSDAWYATVGVPVVKKVKVYGRWDCFRSAKTWGTLHTDWGLSANWWLCKNLLFQGNYTRSADRATDRHYNTFDLQIAARF